MPEFHAKLSPSASKLWLHSPACYFTEPAPLTDEEQAFFEEYVPRSSAADEGTLGHEIVEALLTRELKDEKFFRPSDGKLRRLRDMRKSEHYSAYLYRLAEWSVQQVLDIVDAYDGNISALYLEKRVTCDSIHPDLWGTSDVVIIAENYKVVHIVDFKFGRLPVHAEDNPQLMIYGYGAVSSVENNSLWDRVETVRGTIIQPRDYDRDDMEIRARKLHRWGQKVVKPKALAVMNKEGEMQPSLATCRYCDHRVTDRKHREMYIEIMGGWETMGARPNTLDKKQIQKIAENAPALKQWLDDVVNYATAQALSGVPYEKLKLVKGRNYRRFNNEKAVRRKLKRLGYEPKEYLKPKPLQTLTEIEALVGRTVFERDFGKYVNTTTSKPKLVPLSNKGLPAANNIEQAEQDFAEFIK